MFCVELRRLRCPPHRREQYWATQAQVAGVLGVSPPRISEWERRVRTPKPLTQEAILPKVKACQQEHEREVRERECLEREQAEAEKAKAKKAEKKAEKAEKAEKAKAKAGGKKSRRK